MRCGIVRWSWIVLALLAAHDVTHLADGGLDTSPGQLALVAIPQWIVLALVMGIIVRDPAHRRARAGRPRPPGAVDLAAELNDRL